MSEIARGSCSSYPLRMNSASPNLDAFFQSVRSLIGSKHVVTAPEEIELKSKDTTPETHRPSGFIYPESVEQVQEITRLANKYQVALWPCSTGKNWGYGAATPAQAGSVTLVLSRLNRVIKVDQELAFAVVEPGVTYRQLHQHLEMAGLPLWLDCTDGPADGSVMGNALDRGVGETNYGDHFGNICGMEVVLPDGSLVETGGGPRGRHQSWNTYKWGVGPYLEGLFTQSNFGIVTKIGIWLMPKPEHFVSCLFELREEKDLPLMIESMRRLQLHGAIQSKAHIINDVITFSIIADSPSELLAGAPFLSDDRRRALQREHNVSPWTFAAGIYGTRAQVAAHIKLIKKELRPLGRLQFIDDLQISLVKRMIDWVNRQPQRSFPARLGQVVARLLTGKPFELIRFLPHVHAIEKGYPSDFFVKHAYYKSRKPKPSDSDIDPARDECGLIWLGPMVPLTGAATQEVIDLVRPLYLKYGFDFTVALMVANPRTLIALFSVFYDKSSSDETSRAKNLYLEMGAATQTAGYQQYRTSTLYMPHILEVAPEFKRLCGLIKGALDPVGVIAPGRYGIPHGPF